MVINVVTFLLLKHAWVYKHFPTIGQRELNGKHTKGLPRVSRWTIGKRLLSLADYRSALDELTIDRVLWMPYKEHCNVCPFGMLSLFSGYIQLGSNMHLHFPKRVLQQFDYTQNYSSTPIYVYNGTNIHLGCRREVVEFFIPLGQVKRDD